MSEPLFSIVIPTRNRANLLKDSLRTALAQDFDDYEVVVCDNNSPDDTREVARSLDNGKVRYHRTDRTLCMPDNWEHAWTKTTGRYVIYLSDDDALLPEALSFLRERVLPERPAVVTFEECRYVYPDWIEPALRNTMMIPVYPEEIRRHECRDVLEDLYATQDRKWYPRMLNCCVDRSVFEAHRRKLGRLFFYSCPDFSFMSVALHLCRQMHAVYRPLRISGVSTQSIGSVGVTTRGEVLEEFVRQFGGVDLFEDCLTKIPVVPNYIMGSYLRVHKALAAAGVEPVRLDLHRHLVNCAQGLRDAETFVPAMSRYRPDLAEAAAKLSEACARDVRSVLDADRNPFSVRFRRLTGGLIQSSQALCRLELALRHRGRTRDSFRWFRLEPGVRSYKNEQIEVRGEAFDCSSIFDMAKIAGRVYEKYSGPLRRGERP